MKARQESAAALSELLNGLTGDISAKLGFAEGSPEKTALHAAVGAMVAQMAGGDVATGALSAALSEIANAVVQDLLKAYPDLNDAQKASLTQWAADTVGAAVGGQLGAATALDNVNHNYLTHEQLDRLAAELKGCASEPDSAACEQRVSQRYEQLDFAQERAFEACRTMACAEEHLSQMQFDQKRLYAQILAIQELGPDSALGQRLLANQVNERPLTGDGSVLDHRIMDVLAGISYCEANGGSEGCFETGQRVKFFSEAVTLAAYTALGISNLNRGNGSVRPGQGDAVHGGAGGLPNSQIVPGGGLQAHEAAGGHLISRHVGKSDADLSARLNAQPRINAASSFPDRATAERAVSSALNANAANISQFLNGSGGRLVIDHNLATPIGHVMSRGSTTSTQSSNIRVVIQRDASMPTGYRIITGFPIP